MVHSLGQSDAMQQLARACFRRCVRRNDSLGIESDGIQLVPEWEFGEPAGDRLLRSPVNLFDGLHQVGEVRQIALVKTDGQGQSPHRQCEAWQ